MRVGLRAQESSKGKTAKVKLVKLPTARINAAALQLQYLPDVSARQGCSRSGITPYQKHLDGKLELADSSEADPNGARKWIRFVRTFGNGGFFSFSGFYYSRSWGSYRAFVTDRYRTVVLRFTKRTVVLSPAEPESQQYYNHLKQPRELVKAKAVTSLFA